MTEPAANSQIARFVADLRKVGVFADLPEDDLIWLAERMDEVQYPAGDIYGREGDPIDHLAVLLEGEIQIVRNDGHGNPILTAAAGQVTGRLPFSRLTNFRGTARAVLPTRALRLHRQHFPELVQRSPELAQRLVALMSDRIREITRSETQQEKLVALGKLSAGLAHELNNPAAAAQRSAQGLSEALENVRSTSLRLMRHPLTDSQRDAIFKFELRAGEASATRTATPSDPLELSDREDQIASWLQKHNVADPWNPAHILAEAGVTVDAMEKLSAVTGDGAIGDALLRVSHIVTIFGLIREIQNSTKRISDLVTAIKRYSYMDQAPIQEVDLKEDLENTLIIFGHALKKGITVTRDYDPHLARVCAYGSELNQVWTNLIDNAIGAMSGKGELRVRTMSELDFAIVEIGDNGPGVPPEIQSRIFEPFFTTKKMGEGTGMGLDTVARIMRTHHGTIELKSKPGDTVFRVRLPFKQPKATA